MSISKPVLREFAYRPNRVLLVFLFLLACAGEVLMGYFALYADRGVNARGIELTKDQFRLLMGTFAVLGPLGLAGMGALLVSSFIHKRRIAFTHDSIILPKPTRMGLSTEEVELPFSQIRACEVTALRWPNKALVLYIEPGAVPIPRGMITNAALFIPSVMFPSRADFDALAALVAAAVDKRDKS